MAEIEFGEPEKGGVSRRTVTKGIAWAVPAIAIATATPAFAASPVPPPIFDWKSGCATTGSGGGCANQATTPQFPFTITNPTAQTLHFQVLGQKSWNPNQGGPPDNYSPPAGIYVNSGLQSSCGSPIGTIPCPSPNPNAYTSVTLAPGASASLWIVGNSVGNASSFSMHIQYQWIQTDCVTVVDGPHVAIPDVAIPSNNCGA